MLRGKTNKIKYIIYTSTDDLETKGMKFGQTSPEKTIIHNKYIMSIYIVQGF